MKKIGLVSFVPDAGHIIPLLRIAQAFAEHEFEVVCFFPEEGVRHAWDFGFSVKSIGCVTEKARLTVFDDISSSSTIYYLAFGNELLSRDYFAPMGEYIDKNFFRIVELINEEGLSLILADRHVFEGHYEKLSRLVKVPLVVHHSEGSIRYMQNEINQHFGLNRFPSWIGVIIPVFYRPKSYFKEILRSLLLRKRIESKQLPFSCVMHISSGLGVIEKDVRGVVHEPAQSNIIQFAPVLDRRYGRISKRIEEWLDRSLEKPVIYVCLGTMVRAPVRILKQIIHGLKMLDVRILAILSEKQRSELQRSGVEFDENLLTEEFVPQTEILSHRNVVCSINHGGSGAVQESLMCGKPMLCIPFAFDQPYNSSIVSSLGAGICIDKSRVAPKKVRAAVSSIISNPSYKESASRIKEKLTKAEAGKSIYDLIDAEIM